MLFANKRPPRLSNAEVEEIRKRAQAIPSSLGDRAPNLVDVFALFGETDHRFATRPPENSGSRG